MIKKEDECLVFTGRIRKADSFLGRLQGLMLKKRFPNAYDALALLPCNAVHTMFMRFAIDVLFLNQDDEIIALFPKMRPWHFTPRLKQAELVLELPAGSINHFKIQRGDILQWRTPRG